MYNCLHLDAKRLFRGINAATDIYSLRFVSNNPKLNSHSRFGRGLHVDKIAHIIAYGIMGFLAYLSVSSVRKRFYFFFIVISLGLVLELFQLYVPGRSASFFDIIANTLGAVLGYLCAWLALAYFIKNSFLLKAIENEE